jgi:hypothetical protein
MTSPDIMLSGHTSMMFVLVHLQLTFSWQNLHQPPGLYYSAAYSSLFTILWCCRRHQSGLAKLRVIESQHETIKSGIEHETKLSIYLCWWKPLWCILSLVFVTSDQNSELVHEWIILMWDIWKRNTKENRDITELDRPKITSASLQGRDPERSKCKSSSQMQFQSVIGEHIQNNIIWPLSRSLTWRCGFVMNKPYTTWRHVRKHIMFAK